jgi:hypothetical protein
MELLNKIDEYERKTLQVFDQNLALKENERSVLQKAKDCYFANVSTTDRVKFHVKALKKQEKKIENFKTSNKLLDFEAPVLCSMNRVFGSLYKKTFINKRVKNDLLDKDSGTIDFNFMHLTPKSPLFSHQIDHYVINDDDDSENGDSSSDESTDVSSSDESTGEDLNSDDLSDSELSAESMETSSEEEAESEELDSDLNVSDDNMSLESNSGISGSSDISERFYIDRFNNGKYFVGEKFSPID